MSDLLGRMDARTRLLLSVLLSVLLSLVLVDVLFSESLGFLAFPGTAVDDLARLSVT